MRLRRLIELFALLLLLAAPLGPVLGGPAISSLDRAEAAIDLGHCNDLQKSEKGQQPHHAHCSVAAPGVPAAGGSAPPASNLDACRPMRAAFLNHSGLGPEASTPPPRRA